MAAAGSPSQPARTQHGRHPAGRASPGRAAPLSKMAAPRRIALTQDGGTAGAKGTGARFQDGGRSFSRGRALAPGLPATHRERGAGAEREKAKVAAGAGPAAGAGGVAGAGPGPAGSPRTGPGQAGPGRGSSPGAPPGSPVPAMSRLEAAANVALRVPALALLDVLYRWDAAGPGPLPVLPGAASCLGEGRGRAETGTGEPGGVGALPRAPHSHPGAR